MLYYYIIVSINILLLIYFVYALIKGEIVLRPRIYIAIICISLFESLLRNMLKLLLLSGG